MLMPLFFIPARIFRQRRLPAAGRDQPQAEAGSHSSKISDKTIRMTRGNNGIKW